MTFDQNERLTYEQHEHQWKMQHKDYLPKRKVVSAGSLVGGLLIWSVILIATSVLSGAHSIPTVATTIPIGGIIPDENVRNAVAALGFAMLELTIFAAAMYKARSRYAKSALALSLVAGVLANENSAVTTAMTVDSNFLRLIVAIIVGLAAPLTAYFSGEMVGNLFTDYAKANRIADTVYEEEKRKTNDKINSAWTKYLKQFETDGVTLEIVEPDEDEPEEKNKRYSQAELDLADLLNRDQNEGMSITSIMKHYNIKGRGTAAAAKKLANERLV